MSTSMIRDYKTGKIKSFHALNTAARVCIMCKAKVKKRFPESFMQCPSRRRCKISHDLSDSSYLVSLIIADAHRKTLHIGMQLAMDYVRSQFWITRAKSLVSSIKHRCLIGARPKATARQQIMGDLTKERLTRNGRPFLAIFCVDYADLGS